MTVSARFDAPLPGSALERRVNPVTGALEVRYPLTWTGVRTYRHLDGRVTRELRRPEQVFAPSHLRTLRRLAATIGHPALDDGTPVFLDARGGPGVTEGGTALRPAEDYQVGHTGDEIAREEVDGYPVPVAWCSVTSSKAQRLIAGGALQSSLGYLAVLDEHDEPRTWEGPHGPEEYDVEHVLDHEDPRVKAAIERGEVPTVRLMVDGAETDVPVLGGNHLAIAIRAGRGARQSEIRLDAVDTAAAAGGTCCGACEGGHAEACDGAGCVAPGAWSAPSAGSRLVAAEDSASAWAGGCGDLTLGLAPGLPVDLPQRALSGQYAQPAGGWLGWIAEGDDAAASPWIAFARPDGLLLAWAQRGEDGGVAGAPCVVARDACGARLSAPAVPAEPAPPSAAVAARDDAGAYAARASAESAPSLQRTPVKKITLSAKLDKAAAQVAQAIGAGAPVRKADSLEIELPEGVDPGALIGALHLIAGALEGAMAKAAEAEGKVAEVEAAKAEADRMAGAAMAEAEQYKADAAALKADAEEGRKVRLERVKGEAKARVAGLTDEDLKGLDADGVIRAAVAKAFPKAASRLDSSPALVEALWDNLPAQPARKAEPVKAPVLRADEDDAPARIAPAPGGARRLTAHEID